MTYNEYEKVVLKQTLPIPKSVNVVTKAILVMTGNEIKSMYNHVQLIGDKDDGATENSISKYAINDWVSVKQRISPNEDITSAIDTYSGVWHTDINMAIRNFDDEHEIKSALKLKYKDLYESVKNLDLYLDP